MVKLNGILKQNNHKSTLYIKTLNKIHEKYIIYNIL